MQKQAALFIIVSLLIGVFAGWMVQEVRLGNVASFPFPELLGNPVVTGWSVSADGIISSVEGGNLTVENNGGSVSFAVDDRTFVKKQGSYVLEPHQFKIGDSIEATLVPLSDKSGLRASVITLK